VYVGHGTIKNGKLKIKNGKRMPDGKMPDAERIGRFFTGVWSETALDKRRNKCKQ